MEECPECGGSNIVGVEYHGTHPEHYDGISEWRCESCGYREGRFTGKKLKMDEVEKKYGG